jgi:tetratricopeptide (TPR) repeat protein
MQEIYCMYFVDYARGINIAYKYQIQQNLYQYAFNMNNMMTLPTWGNFIDKISKLEKKVDDELSEGLINFSNEHPMLAKTLKTSFNILPPPMNEIAKSIFESFDGSNEDKWNEVKKYFEKIEEQGEVHYIAIIGGIKKIIENIDDIETIIAKNTNTIILLRETLISEGNNITQNLDKLKNKIDKVMILQEKLENNLFQSYGLNFLPLDYFELFQNTEKNYKDWQKGRSFELQSINANLEFRRDGVLEIITRKLENSGHLLILGESGTSKSTVLKEIICDYYKNGYKILFNLGTGEIINGIQLSGFISDLLNDNQKILLAVDDAHEKGKAVVFYLVDHLSGLNAELRKNLRIIITARNPEFDMLVTDGLEKVPESEYRKSISKLAKDLDFEYSIPNFEKSEIKEFIKKYARISPVKEDDYEKIFDETRGGIPIMVKFAVLGTSLYEDVQNRYNHYIKNSYSENEYSMRIQTAIVCSLLDIAGVTVNDRLLKDINLWEGALALKDAILYYDSDETKKVNKWSTLHPRWDMELLSFLYNNIEVESVLNKRKKYLNDAIESIFKSKDEKATTSVTGLIYDLATRELIPIDIVESVFHMPGYLTNDQKCSLYIFYIAKSYTKLAKLKLRKYDDVVYKCEEAIKINRNYSPAWNYKGYAFYKLGKQFEENSEEASNYYNKALECYEITIDQDPNYANAWFNKGVVLDKLNFPEKAIECYNNAIGIDSTSASSWFVKAGIPIEMESSYASLWEMKGSAYYKLEKYEEAINCYDEALKLAPKWIEPLQMKCKALSNLGRSLEAQNCFKETLM